MLKVGIITKHKIFNYGTFMQAYATQRAIEKLGFYAEIIDYKYPNEFHGTHPTFRGKLLHSINYFLKNLLPGRLGKAWIDAYNECFAKYYKLGKSYKSQEEIMNEPPIYDVYVVGSDQLWRPEFTNGDPVFFGAFAPKHKKVLSYASSFGCLSIPDKYRESYKLMLSRFSSISVRERSGVDIVKELSGRNAELVVDPSLLLSAEEWKKIMKKPRISQPYMICYGNLAIDYVNDLAQKIVGDRDILIVRTNGKFTDYFNRKIHYLLDVGPLEWLGLLANAEFVLAGSFHGTVFSVQFHRPFMSIVTGDKDHDSRQMNLMSELGLENNALYIGEQNLTNIEEAMFSINWEKTEKKMTSLRKKSMDYLCQSLL